MDSAPSPGPADVAREVRQLAEKWFPGLVVEVELRVKHPSGRESVVYGAGGPATVTLTERQRDIVQALEEAGEGARLSGAALAKLSGYDCDSHFREDLSRLGPKGLGIIVNHNPGYSLARP